jgi:hypothetical protein
MPVTDQGTDPKEVTLNSDGMMWLMRHIFQCLSHKDDPSLWP